MTAPTVIGSGSGRGSTSISFEHLPAVQANDVVVAIIASKLTGTLGVDFYRRWGVFNAGEPSQMAGHVIFDQSYAAVTFGEYRRVVIAWCRLVDDRREVMLDASGVAGTSASRISFVVLRGCPVQGSPIDLVGVDVASVATVASVSVPAITTTGADERVLTFGYADSDITFTDTNGTLAGFAIESQGFVTGVGSNGTSQVASGTKAVAGSSGATTLGASANDFLMGVQVAVKNGAITSDPKDTFDRGSTPLILADNTAVDVGFAASGGTATSGDIWLPTLGRTNVVKTGTDSYATDNSSSVASIATFGYGTSTPSVPIQATIKPGVADSAIIFRFQDSGNYYRLGGNNLAGPITLTKVVANVSTTLHTFTHRINAFFGTHVAVDISVAGQIDVYIEGTLAASISDASVAGTSHGIRCAGTTSKVLDFGYPWAGPYSRGLVLGGLTLN